MPLPPPPLGLLSTLAQSILYLELNMIFYAGLKTKYSKLLAIAINNELGKLVSLFQFTLEDSSVVI